MSFRSRYFDLLGRAYDVPEGAERFDDFLNGAMAFFFADENGAALERVAQAGTKVLHSHSTDVARALSRFTPAG